MCKQTYGVNVKRGSGYQQLERLSKVGIRNNENKDKWKFGINKDRVYVYIFLYPGRYV